MANDPQRSPRLAVLIDADNTSPRIAAGLFDEVAKTLARAAGHWGSCANYLYQTITKLEEYGIHDSHLWKLQEMVAEEIRKLG